MELAIRKIAPNSGHAAALALLEELYQAKTGTPMPPIVRTSRGKPYWENNPLHFSISHTPSHVVCVLSENPVGVDAEECSRQVNPKLAEKILSGEEFAQYRLAEDKNRALLTFWVLKEALAKCTGEGLRGFPNHTAFSLTDPRVQETDGCLVAVIEEFTT